MVGLSISRIRLGALAAAVTLVAVLLLAALPARDADTATRIVKVRNTGNEQCKQSIFKNSRGTVKRSGCKARITVKGNGVSQKVDQDSRSGGGSQRIVVRR